MSSNDKLLLRLITYYCCLCDFDFFEVLSSLSKIDKEITSKYYDYIDLICRFGEKLRKVIPNESK